MEAVDLIWFVTVNGKRLRRKMGWLHTRRATMLFGVVALVCAILTLAVVPEIRKAVRLKILRRGVIAWNEFRASQPDVRIDLRGADLSGIDLTAIRHKPPPHPSTLSRMSWLFDATLSASERHAEMIQESGCEVVDLRNVDLSLADLRGAKLVFADLAGAMLAHADLREAELIGAALCGADLRGARLDGASLNGADLTEANLTGATIDRAWLPHATLERVDLRHVSGWDTAHLYDASISDARHPPEGFLERARADRAYVDE